MAIGGVIHVLGAARLALPRASATSRGDRRAADYGREAEGTGRDEVMIARAPIDQPTALA
jgi:hypothetical protein